MVCKYKLFVNINKLQWKSDVYNKNKQNYGQCAVKHKTVVLFRWELSQHTDEIGRAGREKPVPVQSGGGWAIAQSPIFGNTITVERLEKRGYISLLEPYNQIKPNTALFPMTWRTAVYENRNTVVWEPLPVSVCWWGGLLDYALFYFKYEDIFL